MIARNTCSRLFVLYSPRAPRDLAPFLPVDLLGWLGFSARANARIEALAPFLTVVLAGRGNACADVDLLEAGATGDPPPPELETYTA